MRALLEAALPKLSERQYMQFNAYYELLVDWNSRMNLTALTEPEDVAYKHFADSVLPEALISPGARVIDVGTGAGFPGIPLKILRPDIRLTLLDSLNKRITFLNAVCEKLGFDEEGEAVVCIHARAEDAAKRGDLRAAFDIATSRAVASGAALSELTLPFLRVGGQSLMYKGPQATEELEGMQNALRVLRANARIIRFDVPWGERNVIDVTKTGQTPAAYPRKAGEASRNPL